MKVGTVADQGAAATAVPTVELRPARLEQCWTDIEDVYWRGANSLRTSGTGLPFQKRPQLSSNVNVRLFMRSM